MQRYIRNQSTISLEENELLKSCKVCVVGCGGIGGHIIEMLSRIGVGSITAVDGDVFEESNLNRQILSDTASLGKSKAQTAKERITLVNPHVEIHPVFENLTEANGHRIIEGHQVIVDALDNLKSRLLLQQLAEELEIPLVHGSIAGWYGQVTTIFPKDRTLEKLYANANIKGVEKELGNPSFTPANIASIQVSEVIKILIKRGSLLRNKLMFVNLLDMECSVIDI